VAKGQIKTMDERLATLGIQSYLFTRRDGYMIIDCKDDEEAKKCAEMNPGTLKAINTFTDETIWVSSTLQ